MHNNFRTFIYVITFIIYSVYNIEAQVNQRFSISIAAGISKTGSLAYSDTYKRFSNSSTIVITKKSPSRNNNYKFSLGFQPSKSISINGSIGVASYGFSYAGDIIASPTNMATSNGIVVREDFATRLMEVGLSVLYRLNITNDVTYIIEPGLVWYTNPKENFRQVLGINMNSNNFSGTFFTGIEVPIKGNNFYASIGFNTKLAFGNFATTKFENKFQPFAVGLQTSIHYRFGSFGE